MHHSSIFGVRFAFPGRVATRLAVVVAAMLMLAPGLIPEIAAAEAPAAILASASGEVTILRAGKPIPASFGAPLQAGDRVVAGKNGKASVLYSSGQLVELSPGNGVNINGASGEGEGGDLLAQMPETSGDGLDRFAQTASGDEGLSVLPTLRSGSGGELTLLHPRNTLVRPDGIQFSWTEVPDALEYSLSLTGPDGKSHTARAAGTHWTPTAEIAMAADQKWSWSVEAVTIDGALSSSPVEFEIAGDATSRAVRDLETRLSPLLSNGDATRAAAAQYLLGSYCRTAGLYGDAIGHFELIVQAIPDRRDLFRELGSLYEAVGRPEQAAAAYRRALDDSER